MHETDNSRLLGTSVEFVGHKRFSIEVIWSFTTVSTPPHRSCGQMITPLEHCLKKRGWPLTSRIAPLFTEVHLWRRRWKSPDRWLSIDVIPNIKRWKTNIMRPIFHSIKTNKLYFACWWFWLRMNRGDISPTVRNVLQHHVVHVCPTRLM